MAVVDSLDTSSARSIILGCRHLKLPVIRKRTHTLDKSLSVGPAAQNGCTVQVLECTGNNLGRRSSAGVHKDNYRNLSINRLCDSTILTLRIVRISFRRHYERALRHKQGDDIDSLAHKTATISAKVQDKLLHALLLQFEIGIAHICRHILRKTGLQNITRSIIDHSGILHIRQVDSFADNSNFHSITGIPSVSPTQFLHVEHNRSPRLAFHSGRRT